MFSPRFFRNSGLIALSAMLLWGLSFGIVRSQDTNSKEVQDANAKLQAVGGLGVGHIQSSLGLIGVTADAFAKEVYTAKQVVNVYNALQKEAKALVTFAKSKKPADAELFDAARKAAVAKLGQLTESGGGPEAKVE